MKEILFDITDIRVEISFKSLEELRLILFFLQENNLNKINIPCKNNLKKDFLLEAIKIVREDFPLIDLIPHFSILHEFKKNRINTINSLIEFIKVVKSFGCKEVLIVSGSQKRSTLDSVSALSYLKDNNVFYNSDLSIGVAFNPYLPSFLFDDEIINIEKKLKSGLISSIWIQFGTDCNILESRIAILKKIILSEQNTFSKKKVINLYGSILIPSKQFLARFRYRPWKGVYCSNEFLKSLEFANNFILRLLKTYKKYEIHPIIETNVSNKDNLNALKKFL